MIIDSQKQEMKSPSLKKVDFKESKQAQLNIADQLKQVENDFKTQVKANEI
jgi:hypothetical protein